MIFITQYMKADAQTEHAVEAKYFAGDNSGRILSVYPEATVVEGGSLCP